MECWSVGGAEKNCELPATFYVVKIENSESPARGHQGILR